MLVDGKICRPPEGFPIAWGNVHRLDAILIFVAPPGKQIHRTHSCCVTVLQLHFNPTKPHSSTSFQSNFKSFTDRFWISVWGTHVTEFQQYHFLPDHFATGGWLRDPGPLVTYIGYIICALPQEIWGEGSPGHLPSGFLYSSNKEYISQSWLGLFHGGGYHDVMIGDHTHRALPTRDSHPSLESRVLTVPLSHRFVDVFQVRPQCSASPKLKPILLGLMSPF